MFTIDLDFSEIFELKDLKLKCELYAAEYSNALAKETYGKVMEWADQRLHSRKGTFMDNLYLNPTDKNSWSIVLGPKAAWIEDGQDAHSMIQAMLKSRKVKTGKQGKYLIVPFEHTRGGNFTPAQASLRQTVKSEMSRLKMDSAWSSRSKKIGSFNVGDRPTSTHSLPIGKGPKGQAAQGVTGIPILHGVNVYQKHSIKSGVTKINAFTFRTISEHSHPGSWQHPGNAPTNIMKDAAEWAEKQAETYLAKIIERL